MRTRGIVAVMVMGAFLGTGRAIAQRGQQPPAGPVVLKITDFGAIADGTTVNTVAIQKALNACSASGGRRLR